jgi:hypothetical protein
MLIFELFPAFVMFAGVAAGVWLWFVDRQDRNGPDD